MHGLVDAAVFVELVGLLMGVEGIVTGVEEEETLEQ